MIAHDGNAGSNLVEFDGDFASVSYLEGDVRGTPFTVLAPNPKVLIIGAAGGHEVLASLYHGAREIAAVEPNRVTVELTRGPYADYTGRIAYDPRVTWINGEGRSFIQRSKEKYDLIRFVAPDSYAAIL
jgi:spermidine synthase